MEAFPDPPSLCERLERQMRFIVEIDRLKSVLRQTLVHDASRQENDAEHSWHLAIMAVFLNEYAAGDALDVLRVLKMVLIHDLVEIDAGDTYCYDEAAHADKAEREEAAAERIFGILPPDQAHEVWDLWREFEAMETPEASFAAALDRLQPMLSNYHTQGEAWKRHGIRRSQVLKRNAHIRNGAPKLWDYAEALVNDAVDKGYLADG